MPLFGLAALAGTVVTFLTRIFFASILIKIAVFGAMTYLVANFTNEMIGYVSSITMPTLSPYILNGFALLPANTDAYITLCISAVIAKWLFIASIKGLEIFR